jgi:hypothetical protein
MPVDHCRTTNGWATSIGSILDNRKTETEKLLSYCVVKTQNCLNQSMVARKLTAEVAAVIKHVARSHPDWTRRQVHAEVMLSHRVGLTLVTRALHEFERTGNIDVHPGSSRSDLKM